MEAAAPISKNYARNLKKSINRTFSSTPCENLAPINYQNGILQTPPILYHSFPPFLAHQKQPPLLPLPISKSSVHQHYNHINILSQNRAISCPPINRRVNGNVKSKKSKSSTSSPKKDQESPKSSNVVMVSSTKSLGPDPKDLPKDVSMVLSMSSTGQKEQSVGAQSSSNARNPKKDDANKNQLSLLHTNSFKEISDYKVNKFSGSVVFTTVSPPPSSLPLPTFSLRPKLSCNAEASAGVDAGATDNLRRLLRLR